MRTINFSDARSNLKKVLDTVVDDCDVTIITRRDAGDVVVMSLESFNSWRETEYLLSNPYNARHLLEGIACLDAGKGETHELIEPGTTAQVAESRPSYRTRAAAHPKRSGKPAPGRAAAKKRD